MKTNEISVDYDYYLDASGLKCPLPLLRAKKQLSQMHAGEQLLVLSTDPNSIADFIAFGQMTDHELLKYWAITEGTYFLIKK